MKKLLYVSLGVLVVLIGAIIILQSKDKSVKVESRTDVVNYLNNNDTFLLVIGSSTCPHCIDYKGGTLKQYIKDPKIPLHFIYSDTSFANQTDLENFLKQYNINYTASPSSYVVKNGKVVAKVEGDISLQELNQFIDKNI